LAVTAGLVVIADQISKDIALGHLEDGPVDLIHGWLGFRLVYNTGAAFGVGRGWPLLFMAVTLAVVSTIVFVTPRLSSGSFVIPLGMIAGGGLSNVADRILRSHAGRVIDFIDLHHWPVFNLADSAIVAGVALTVVLSWIAAREQ
jgi:signal peptidase II